MRELFVLSFIINIMNVNVTHTIRISFSFTILYAVIAYKGINLLKKRRRKNKAKNSMSFMASIAHTSLYADMSLFYHHHTRTTTIQTLDFLFNSIQSFLLLLLHIQLLTQYFPLSYVRHHPLNSSKIILNDFHFTANLFIQVSLFSIE